MSFQAKLFDAGLKNVVVLPNAGYGAEEKRIRSMKDLFGSIFFHERVDVEDGLIDALENYHNREDKKDGSGNTSNSNSNSAAMRLETARSHIKRATAYQQARSSTKQAVAHL